jgi:hypothetical protein
MEKSMTDHHIELGDVVNALQSALACARDQQMAVAALGCMLAASVPPGDLEQFLSDVLTATLKARRLIDRGDIQL